MIKLIFKDGEFHSLNNEPILAHAGSVDVDLTVEDAVPMGEKLHLAQKACEYLNRLNNTSYQTNGVGDKVETEQIEVLVVRRMNFRLFE